jgi:large subunit ribosomal protein L30
MAVKKTQPEGKKRTQAKTPERTSKDKFLKVKLVKSIVGRPQKQRDVVRGLGLRKLQSEVIRRDCPEIWGMIRKVHHLVRVEVVREQ